MVKPFPMLAFAWHKSDVVAFCAFIAFGLWWVLAPSNVIRFYTWFHRGLPDPQPKPIGIRIAGAGWILLMVLVFLFA